MKVIIAGGREFNDYNRLCSYCDHVLQDQGDIEIVSGNARGADLLGEKFGEERKYKVTSFPADWDTFGNSAGYRRNAEMADYADVLIAFWDGRSKGTKHMIDLARNKGLDIRIYNYGRKNN